MDFLQPLTLEGVRKRQRKKGFMKCWIVTPSFNQLDWLKLCVASVADQAMEGMVDGSQSIEVHHHIQDGGSTDGTVEWLERYANEVRDRRVRHQEFGIGDNEEPNAQLLKPSAYSFSFSSEKDEGMYDAINKGWEKAPEDADVLAHLNCDEQYLPGALPEVAPCFMRYPDTDVVFANMIVVDEHGDYVCHRRPLPPRPVLSRLFIPGFTCTTFQRRSVFFHKGCRFDTSWKNLGDVVWYLALIEEKCRFKMLNVYTSVFADMESNLNLQESGRVERVRYYQALPGWMRRIYPVAHLVKRLRYAARMFLSKAPRSYGIYLTGSECRINKSIAHPTCVWRKRRAWRHALVQAGRENRG